MYTYYHIHWSVSHLQTEKKKREKQYELHASYLSFIQWMSSYHHYGLAFRDCKNKNVYKWLLIEMYGLLSGVFCWMITGYSMFLPWLYLLVGIYPGNQSHHVCVVCLSVQLQRRRRRLWGVKKKKKIKRS